MSGSAGEPARDPILVWGAGAIGGTLGAAFIVAGEEVVFVDTDAAHVAAIAERGLAVTGPVAPCRVEARAFRPEALSGHFRRCILAVKAHHTAGAVAALAPHVAPDGYVVSAQNGLNEDVIAAWVGRERTVGCFVNYGADYLEPGVVIRSGRGAVVVGELDGAMTDRLVELHGLFRQFDPAAVATGNIQGYLWAKLIYGALLFATALTDDSIADVLASKAHRRVLIRLAHEVAAVSRAEGVTLEAFDGFDPVAFLPDAPAGILERSFDDMVAHNRRSVKSHSGIWRDLAVRKRRTEVDAQLGPIITAGRRHGVPTPVTSAVTERIHAIEDGRRTLGGANLDDLAAPEPARQELAP